MIQLTRLQNWYQKFQKHNDNEAGFCLIDNCVFCLMNCTVYTHSLTFQSYTPLPWRSQSQVTPRILATAPNTTRYHNFCSFISWFGPGFCGLWIRIQAFAESGTNPDPNIICDIIIKWTIGKFCWSKADIYPMSAYTPTNFKERSGSFNMQFLHFFFFVGTVLACLDLDPDLWSKIPFGYRLYYHFYLCLNCCNQEDNACF